MFTTQMPVSPIGLKIAYEVVSSEEEAKLIELIEGSDLTRKSYDIDNPRSSTSFGWTYDLVNDTFVPCSPLPEGFCSVRETAAAFANVAPADLVECLLNRYEPGAIIQSHLDKPVWEHVIGISLGAQVTMEFRKKSDGGCEYIPIDLPPRSMYLLTGDARYVFEHGLPAVQRTRWSITFRSYSEEGRALRDRSSAVTRAQ